MESSQEVYPRKTKVITESEFRDELKALLVHSRGIFKSVTGPGRSGAIAAVYVSHYLKIPYIPYKQMMLEHLTPLLIIDTAMMTGRTLRKAHKYYINNGVINEYKWIYHEPPRVKFWYEVIGE